MSTWNSPWLSGRFSLAAWRGSPWQTSRGWNPRYLFLAGQQGAWYDPSDLSTLFQDSAGTTPVTADGDPVGLMLDKSQGLALGVELVNDPGFDNPPAWQQGGSWVVSGGAASTDGALSGSVFSAATLAEGNTYKVTVTVNSISGGSVQAFVGSGSTYTISSPGTHTFYLPKGTNDNVGVFAGSGVSAEVESFSTRELSGNHATQTTSASRPVYRTDGTLHWLEFDGVDDFMPTGAQVIDGVNYYMAAASANRADENPGVGFASSADSALSHVLYVDTRTSPMRLSRVGGDALNVFINRATKMPPDQSQVISALRSDTSASGWVDSTLSDTVATTGSSGNVSDFRIGNYANLFGQLNFYGGLAVDRLVTSAERINAEQHLAQKAGVTL